MTASVSVAIDSLGELPRGFEGEEEAVEVEEPRRTRALQQPCLLFERWPAREKKELGVAAMCNKLLDSMSCCEHQAELFCRGCHCRRFGPKGIGSVDVRTRIFFSSASALAPAL